MIAAPHEAQIGESVVESVAVLVVDDEAIWNWPVLLLPPPPMLENEHPPWSPLGASGLGPAEHPVAVLLISARGAWAFALEVGAALLVAVDSLVSGVGGFSRFAASSTHESQRFRPFSHGGTIAVGLLVVKPILPPSTFSPATP